MHTLLRPAGVVVLLALACAAVADPPPDAKEIARLVGQLGDDDADIREAAKKKLLDIGEPALQHLRKAAKDHPDADVRLRARVLERGMLGQLRAFTGHTGHVRSLAVSKDGKRALSGSMDGTARVWDLDSGKELQKFTGHLAAPLKDTKFKTSATNVKWVWSVAFSPDEQRAISSGSLDRALRLWGVQDGKEVRKFEGHTGWVYAATFSPDGKYVLSSGAGNEAKDYTVRLWDVESGKEVRKFEGHTGYVWRAIFSPDGKKVASVGCNDKSYRVWDTETGKPLVIGANAHDGQQVVGVSFSPDGKHLLTGGRDLTCKLWDVTTGKLVKTYTGAANGVEAVAFARDGKRFLAAERNAVHVFDTETGKIVHRFDEHTGAVFAVAWLPDGTRALSGGEDNVVRMWRVPR